MGQLDRPGAGLPKLENWIANRLVRVGAWMSSRGSNLKRMHSERDIILASCRKLAREQGSTQVLIDRIIGIEDNSRDWSVFMTLEHLCIVHAGMTSIIESLTGGEEFSQVVRIEDVKPSPNAGPEFVQRFEQSVEDFQDSMNSISSFNKVRTHAHPWFGELHAMQWMYAAGMHQGIHRKQIERIVAKL